MSGYLFFTTKLGSTIDFRNLLGQNLIYFSIIYAWIDYWKSLEANQSTEKASKQYYDQWRNPALIL